MHLVYIYYDPTRGHIPFYVGKAKTTAVAYRHMDGRSHSPTVSGRIRKIRDAGFEPKVGIIICEDNAKAALLETQLIAEYGRKNLDTGSLLNLTDGGDGETGRVITDAMKQRMSLAQLGKKQKPRTAEQRAAHTERMQEINKRNIGSTASEETKEKMRQAKLGVSRPEFSKLMKGRPKSQQMRERLSVAKTGVPRPQLTCPHCGKTGGDGNMHRWHFANCKQS